LEEVKILLDKFPQRTDSQREQYQTFKQTFNLLSLRILKQVDIPSPDLALDLANLGEHNWQGLLWPDALLTYAGDGLLAGNAGDATAEDVITLMSDIKMRVRNQLGIQLQEEIQYVGF